MAIEVTVATPEGMSESTADAVLDINFTNEAAFEYAADSNIYYYALLTDSTSGTSLTRKVTFTEHVTTEGTKAVDSVTSFILENTTNLVMPVTASEGRICYKPQ